MIWEIALSCAIAIGVGAGVAYINHAIIFARMKRRWAKEDEQWTREDESSDLKLDGMDRPGRSRVCRAARSGPG